MFLPFAFAKLFIIKLKFLKNKYLRGHLYKHCLQCKQQFFRFQKVAYKSFDCILTYRNFKLLSFGDEAEEDEEDFVVATKKMTRKGNSAHDIAMDPSLSSQISLSEQERKDAIEKYVIYYVHL